MVYPSMGDTLIVKAFVITILGGMGSIHGSILGGYILGLTEALGAMYISVDYRPGGPDQCGLTPPQRSG
jgi:branched-chain amino acid transport system permease protein